MTEDEAKTKWCPMVRFTITTAGPDGSWYPYAANRAGNQHNPYIEGALCIGSACMMWRWYFADGDTHGSKLSTTDGFCGLAGKY